MSLRLGRGLGIKALKRDHPTWAWKAKRDGWNWVYEGRKGDEMVRVSACSVLNGYDDESCTTAWYVTDEHGVTINYYGWGMEDYA